MGKVKNDEKKSTENMSLDEVIRAAKAAGMSYGQYVARQYMKTQQDLRMEGSCRE